SRAMALPAAVAAWRARALRGSLSSARVARFHARLGSPPASFSSLFWASLEGPAQAPSRLRANSPTTVRRSMERSSSGWPSYGRKRARTSGLMQEELSTQVADRDRLSRVRRSGEGDPGERRQRE